MNRVINGWTEELKWVVEHDSRKIIQVDIYRKTLFATLYYIGQERNYRIFQKTQR